MKKIKDFENVNEAGDYPRLVPGAYACKILQVNDLTEKECLEIYFDIVEGEFKNYFKNIKEATKKDYGRAFRSYKDSALPFFKGFITAVEKTNKNYVWDWNEKGLEGKYVVIVFGEEEYVDDTKHEIKINVKPQEFRSGEALREGKIKIPEIRKLTADQLKTFQATPAVQPKPNGVTPPPANETSVDIVDDDLPF